MPVQANVFQNRHNPSDEILTREPSLEALAARFQARATEARDTIASTDAEKAARTKALHVPGWTAKTHEYERIGRREVDPSALEETGEGLPAIK
jgi:hypothetical protein